MGNMRKATLFKAMGFRDEFDLMITTSIIALGISEIVEDQISKKLKKQERISCMREHTSDIRSSFRR
jgi:hypothetical protein